MNIPYMDPYGSYDVMNGDKFFGPAKSRVQRLQMQSRSGPELASGPVSFFPPNLDLRNECTESCRETNCNSGLWPFLGEVKMT